jgi:hypothetical protein
LEKVIRFLRSSINHATALQHGADPAEWVRALKSAIKNLENQITIATRPSPQQRRGGFKRR